MIRDQEDFLQELLRDFRIEASEHYQKVVSGLRQLESLKDPVENIRYIESIYRAFHSLKGASRAVNLLDIEKLCMKLEGVFQDLKKEVISFNPSLLAILYRSTDILKDLLDDIDRNEKKVNGLSLQNHIHQLEEISSESRKNPEKTAPFTPSPSSPVQSLSENSSDNNFHQPEQKKTKIPMQIHVDKPSELASLRVSVAKLNKIFRQAEELTSIKNSLTHYTEKLRQITGNHVKHQGTMNIKSLPGMDNQPYEVGTSISRDLVEKIVFFESLTDSLYRITKNFDELQVSAAKIIDDMMLNIKDTLLSPFSTLLSLIPKIVRDLSAESQKTIHLEVKGDEVLIGRRILEEMKDPMIHLIRNCIDHGIEPTEERIKKGKPAEGTLKVEVFTLPGNKIQIRVEDDGRGIQTEKLVASALKNGLITREKSLKMKENEIHHLIFSSGVSTSPYITDISGRGLGMAIVSENVSRMGGKIEVDSSPKGTRFNITLPQSLNLFQGILIQSGGMMFVLPSESIETILSLNSSEGKKMETRKSILYQDQYIPLARFSSLLNLRVSPESRKEDKLPLIILREDKEQAAILVEKIFRPIEGVLKDLGALVHHLRFFSGSTILGNGRIVPILHVSEIIRNMQETSAESAASEAIQRNSADSEVPIRVLIAEDSITIRALLKNYLESAGFLVTTSIDGKDAFQKLQKETFHIVVSDVEMPKMNGFELTQHIRKTESIKNIPLILVTALETPEDRRKGMDAGANAYIVKSNFEKGNLVETIKKLV